MKIKILLPKQLSIKLYKVLNNTFIIFESSNTCFFLKLYKNIQFAKMQNKLFFRLNHISLNTFLSLKAISSMIVSFFFKKKQFCKKIFLNGLGFKIISLIQKKWLELKIGFSHNIKIFIPISTNIMLYTNKNMIIIEGTQKDTVGNFANKIKSFRVPDNYKGKGIWYKKEIKILKPIKKT